MNVTNRSNQKTLEISDFLNNEYKQYANYSIERGLPGIDGLTIVRRKVLWTLYNNSINTYDKRKKLSWISNMTSAQTSYAHSEDAMEESINKMVNSFTGSNNYAFLSPDGQAGNILDHYPGSARYVKAYLNDNFKLFFDTTDLELCEEQNVDGEYIEPKFLRPKLPLLLLNGVSGRPVFAYKTNIYSYNIHDIIRVMEAYIHSGEILDDDLVPYYKGYKGNITKNVDTKQISIKGIFDKVDDNRYIIKISEIPFNWTQEKYKQSVLNNLKLKRLIKDYDDDSTTKSWDITLYCNKEFYEQDEFIIMKELKLIKNDTENLVIYMPDKLKEYDTIVDIIVDFCDYRVKWTEEKRSRDIKNLETILSLKNELLRFIEFWNNSNDIHLLNKAELTDLLKSNDFKLKHITNFLRIPVVSLTKTKIKELNVEISKLDKQLDTLNNTSSIQMISSSINEFKRLGNKRKAKNKTSNKRQKNVDITDFI